MDIKKIIKAIVLKQGDIMNKESDYITLKWGVLKRWNITNKKGEELLKKYFEHGVNRSAMLQNTTHEQKKIICEIIDVIPGDIYLEWDDKYVSKEDAKKYVMEYRKSNGSPI
jgi:hypothetical protein